MFHWEQEGCYRCTNSMALALFWFSMEHRGTVLMPFWLPADGIMIGWLAWRALWQGGEDHGHSSERVASKSARMATSNIIAECSSCHGSYHPGRVVTIATSLWNVAQRGIKSGISTSILTCQAELEEGTEGSSVKHGDEGTMRQGQKKIFSLISSVDSQNVKIFKRAQKKLYYRIMTVVASLFCLKTVI